MHLGSRDNESELRWTRRSASGAKAGSRADGTPNGARGVSRAGDARLKVRAPPYLVLRARLASCRQPTPHDWPQQPLVSWRLISRAMSRAKRSLCSRIISRMLAPPGRKWLAARRVSSCQRTKSRNRAPRLRRICCVHSKLEPDLNQIAMFWTGNTPPADAGLPANRIGRQLDVFVRPKSG